MIKSKLEYYLGKKIHTSDYIVALDMATQDIKANKIYYKKFTTLEETIIITAMCLHLLERCRS